MSNQLSIRLKEEELEKLDSVRGDVSRSGYATQLLRQLLSKNFEREIEKNTKIDKIHKSTSEVDFKAMQSSINEITVQLGILTNTAQREYNFAEEDEINKRNIDSLNERLQSLTDKFNDLVSKHNAHVENNSSDKKELIAYNGKIDNILKQYDNRFQKIFKILNAELDLNGRLKKNLDQETLELLGKFK
jgi:predicted  nucleic acid-binding Zn-ribbon protein